MKKLRRLPAPTSTQTPPNGPAPSPTGPPPVPPVPRSDGPSLGHQLEEAVGRLENASRALEALQTRQAVPDRQTPLSRVPEPIPPANRTWLHLDDLKTQVRRQATVQRVYLWLIVALAVAAVAGVTFGAIGLALALSARRAAVQAQRRAAQISLTMPPPAAPVPRSSADLGKDGHRESATGKGEQNARNTKTAPAGSPAGRTVRSDPPRDARPAPDRRPAVGDRRGGVNGP